MNLDVRLDSLSRLARGICWRGKGGCWLVGNYNLQLITCIRNVVEYENDPDPSSVWVFR